MALPTRLADGLGVRTRGFVVAATVAGMFAVSHLLMPAVTPAYAVYGRYATYLAVFCVWMAWFVDWLAVRLGQES